VTFIRDRVYPHLVHTLGDPTPIRKVRQRIIPWAQGNVLEIGAGSGANFVHYDPAKVSKLYALEPNPGMIRLADKQRRKTVLDVEFLDLPAERIPLADRSVDTVVSTFTLCAIPAVTDAIRGIARVLKPDGRLIFLEIGLAPDPHVQRWQVRLEGVYRWLFQGLYLTRDIPALIRHCGFRIDQMEAAYIAELPKSSTYCWWGMARPPVTWE
jgi:ubiquinone/menaquinone biosynthesis C-methylase UbiE